MSNVEQFRALVAEASRQAAEATLPSVSERYERSASAWQTMVDQIMAAQRFASANQAAKEQA